MNNYKILICDDSKTEREDINLFLGQIFRNSSDIQLLFTMVSFDTVNEELEKDYDLLILDLFDQQTADDAGTKVLMRNQMKGKIPTVIYTSTGDSIGFDENQGKVKYPALIKKITKVHNSYDNLVEFVKGFIIGNPKNKAHYKLYNENDISLGSNIRYIGDSNFTFIMYQIFEEIGRQIITVYPMASGFSGAILFKLKYSNKTSILKLSTDIEALKKEHDNAIKLYHEFPNHMVNHIKSNEYYALENKVIGILIKNVDDATTFFDLITTSSTEPDKVKKYLEMLYLDGNSLKDHFAVKREEKKDWTAIFQNIDSRKIIMIEKSLKDLNVIIEKYYIGQTIQIDEITNLALDNKYKNLNVGNLTGNEFQKRLVLSHGDFHAKNIMVQNDRPVMIDTGLLGYKHWSLDISRLIVNIFIMGVDNDNIGYYELSNITVGIDMVDRVIQRMEIDLDGVNDNLIIALNWLTSHVEVIYGDLYTLFEFQLGLMKEFLQIAYRIDSVPPSKRALALIAAHKCMLYANENLKSVSK